MLPADTVSQALHSSESRATKLLLILQQADEPISLKSIRKMAEEYGFKIPTSWNCSSILSRTKGQAVKVPQGWKITDAGRSTLAALGFAPSKQTTNETAWHLRQLAVKISDPQTKDFIEEAVTASENRLYRSAVVMSWLAAIDTLHTRVLSEYINEFNIEMRRNDPKWKSVRTKDDFGRIKESIFLDRIAAISIIGKNVKEELKQCLQRRNACGHPNSYRLSKHAVEHHLEVLILNVFQNSI